MSSCSATIEELATGDQVSRRFAELSGVPCFAAQRGARNFLREFGQWWYRDASEANALTAIVPPNPSHATTFWTPLEDLRAAAMTAPADADTVANDAAHHFLGDMSIVSRPIATLSAGERALVALAKCYIMGPLASRAVVCDPGAWLYKDRRYLIAETLARCPKVSDATHFLTFRHPSPSPRPIQPEASITSLSLSLLLQSPVIMFPARRFPTATNSSQIEYVANTSLQLHSPCLISGDNGIGKSSLARALCGLLALESGEASVVIESLKHRPRLLMHDTAMQVFALTPRDHIDWIYRLSKKDDEVRQVFSELQNALVLKLASLNPPISIGDAENPTSLVQAKLALIAERLVGGTRVLVLDEPTWGVCDEIAFPMMSVIAEVAHNRSIRIVVISHNEVLPNTLFHSHIHLALRNRNDQRKVVDIELRRSS